MLLHLRLVIVANIIMQLKWSIDTVGGGGMPMPTVSIPENYRRIVGNSLGQGFSPRAHNLFG